MGHTDTADSGRATTGLFAAIAAVTTAASGAPASDWSVLPRHRLRLSGLPLESEEVTRLTIQNINDPAHGKRSVHCLRPRTARVFALKHRMSRSIAPYHSTAS
jgi:hypothetical protein